MDQLGQDGALACTDTWGKFAIHDANGATTFETMIQGDDMKAAIAGTYDFTVALPASDIDSAIMVANDTAATYGAVATLDAAYAQPEDPNCYVDVRDFCLTDARASSESGKWEFDFTIRVESNSNCGSVDASLDIVADDDFLGNVALDHQDIVSAFDCECDKTITVTADYDGASGDSLYGQLSISNSQSANIQLTNSCTFET